MSNKRRKKSIFEPKRRPRPERSKRPRRKNKRVIGYATQTMRDAWTP